MTSDTTVPASGGNGLDRPRRRVWPIVRDIAVILVIALVASFLIKTFVVRSFFIPSPSMEDTLQINDRILVDEVTPRFGEYDRGDVVVFRDPGGWLPPAPETRRSPFVEAVDTVLGLVGISAPDSDEHLIKRVIGVAGDHVECCNALGQVSVNGTPIDETPYLRLENGQSAPHPMPFDVVVPEDSFWVLGDNRDRSSDSRYHMDQPNRGFVPLENIVGRAFVILWPLSNFGVIDTHHDVFSGVPGAPR